MQNLARSLLNVEPLELDGAAERCAGQFSALARLRDFPCGEHSLLERVQAVMDLIRADPPPGPPAETESVMTPWWEPMPATYAAALFNHVSLPEVALRSSGAAGLMPPHARESACVGREIMREWGIPFPVREHAVALIRHQARPAGLLSSGAPAESYMRAACCVDLRSLHSLRLAELRAASPQRDDAGFARLNAFRKRAEELQIFGQPPPPPLAPEQLDGLGLDDPGGRHRALNALRYFQLVARMAEPEWFVERLRQEKERPPCRLHLLVGPAGSGKSSWALDHLPQTTIVSSDRMREELTGDPADQGQNYLVFQRCMDRVRQDLKEGREVTFDATNCSESLRSMPVQAARWSGAEIVSYFFDVPLEAALARNRGRRRLVPEEVIRNHYRLLEPPALYEADRHLVIDDAGRAEPYWPGKGCSHGSDACRRS